MSTSPINSSEPPQENAFHKNHSLDVLRGAALLGILVTAIWDFGGFRTNEQAFYYLAAKGGNYQLLSFISALFEKKMIALLAILFGAGMIAYLQKKETGSGISVADGFIRNQLWLLIGGVITAFIFLWPNDLLFPFSIVGILLFAFYRLPSKSLLLGAFICLLIYSGKIFWSTQEDKADYKKYTTVLGIEKKFKADSIARAKKYTINKSADSAQIKALLGKKKIADSLAKKNDTLTAKQSEEKSKWEGTVKSFQYDSAKTIAENKAMREGYNKLWFHVKGRSQYKESTWLYSLGVWYLGALMFLGMFLFRIDFFYNRFSKKQYLLLSLVTLLGGCLLAWVRICQTHYIVSNYEQFLKGHFFAYNQFSGLEEILVAIGFASLVLGFIKSKALSWLWYSLSAVGKLALTNYFIQVVACSIVFFGYGLGFYGRFTQWELYFLVAELSLVQIAFSVLWLRYFKKGPVEWLLFGLTYHIWTKKNNPSTNNATEKAI